MTDLSQAEQLLLTYQKDYQKFAGDCIKVRDHNTAQVLPLRFRPGQRVMHEVAEKRKAEKGYLRVMLLKNRRYGGSTYVGGRGYHRASLNFNQSIFIIAHEDKSTTTLYRMVQLMQEQNPIRPSTITSNAIELRFDRQNGKGLKSEYSLATAKNVEAGRSQGIHFLHCCLSGDSRVILSDGSSKAVQHVCVGDEVVTGSGEIARVKNKFRTGIKQVFDVQIWLSNEKIAASAEHKFFTLEGVKKCSELSSRDWILVPRIPITGNIKTYHFKLPKNGTSFRGGGKCPIDEADIPLDRGFGYYLGYYLAEGCVKTQDDGRPCTVHFAYHVKETFIEKACNGFASRYYASQSDFTDNSNRKRTYLYGNFLASLTESICGRTSKKHIPEWFFETNHDFLHGLLEGYFDGDGNKGYRETRSLKATCIRERISRQVKRIVASLGYGVPGCSYREKRFRYEKQTKPIYDVALNGDTLSRFLGSKVEKPHKATKYKEVDGKYYVKLRSVMPSGEVETYDLEIDHPDHNFETVAGVASNSEEAMWPGHSGELLGSLFQCVPRPPSDTEIWRESTGKGYGNSFQIDVFEAYCEGKYPYFTGVLSQYAPHMPLADVEFTFAYHNPESEWILIFIPWILDPSCQKAFESPERKDAFLKRLESGKERKEDVNYGVTDLQRKYKLTLEQLYWREWEIRNQCRGDVGLFKQENPLTIFDAFRTKGSNHYSQEFCDMVEQGCRSPIAVGNIVRRMGVPVIEPNPGGHLSIWETYDPKETYFLTVDAAGGISETNKKESKEPDKTVIDVWNRRTGRQCAQWYGHVDYDLISDVVQAIGEMYGMAIACVELNNHGYKVVGDLKGIEYPMYSHEPGKYGWVTNKKTKPEMADGLLDGCRDGVITIRCKETVAEMRTYIEKSGKFGAESGCHDDRVTTAQIGRQMMSLLPRKIERGQEDHNVGDHNTETQWMAA